MLRRFVCFTLLGLFCLSLLGQKNTGGFLLRVEYESSELQGFDLNDFLRDYNRFYGSNMAQPFDSIGARELSHPSIGVGFRIASGENIGFTSGLFCTYGSKSIQRSAEFQNGIITQTDLRVRDFNVQFDLGIHIKQILFLQGHMGGRFRSNYLDLGYVYQDGSYSLGDEYDILGVYHSPTTTLDFGASIGVKLGPVFIPVSITFPTDFASDDGLLTLMDFDKRQARWVDLPRDFTTWANDPANLDLDNGFVRANSFRSVRLTIAAEFLFGPTNRNGK